MRLSPRLLIAGLGLAMLTPACADEYVPRVICHNANCLEPTNPDLDSTVESLEASLAMEDEDGRPFIDGMEIDTFWYGDEDRCLFAHDLLHPERAVDTHVAVDLINAHLSARQAQGRPLTRRADTFSIFIELKGHVGVAKDEKHSPEQLDAHVDCAVTMAESLVENAARDGYGVEVVYMSFDPNLLLGLRNHPGFAALDASPTHMKLAILQGIPRPLDAQTLPLDEFPEEIGAGVVSVHPHWTRETDMNVYDSRGFELSFWMFDIVPETLQQIHAHRPAYITTSEARLMVASLER
ncbi:MAG: hypothetical protein ACNA8W_05590 [Bradymonadaceae bacterium]